MGRKKKVEVVTGNDSVGMIKENKQEDENQEMTVQEEIVPEEKNQEEGEQKKAEVVETKMEESEQKMEFQEEKTQEKEILEENKSNKKQKKERKSVGESLQTFQNSVPTLIITIFVALLIMGLSCVAIFFTNIKGKEQVLVPNVIGKKWDEALIEMQIKELYPRITMRYSDTLEDEGKILEQDPPAGAIVKGYSRVSLVISRGMVVDEVGDYVGKNYDEVNMSLQTLFAGQSKPLIVLAEPEYKPDISEPGTILEQEPPFGSKITEPVSVQLVVSRGPNYENTRRPYVIGQSINDLLQTIARSKIVFDITAHEALDGEKSGYVVKQEQIEAEYVPNYTRVSVEMAISNNEKDENICGIFQTKIDTYPYPVAMRLEAVPVEGKSYTILNFNHPGGNLTIPYSVAKGTTLILYVAEKQKTSILVN